MAARRVHNPKDRGSIPCSAGILQNKFLMHQKDSILCSCLTKSCRHILYSNVLYKEIYTDMYKYNNNRSLKKKNTE